MSSSLLRRTSGPLGTAILGNSTISLERWELIEGDPDSPHQGHGWFNCTDDSFRARKGVDLDLSLQTWDDGIREVEVTIVQMNRPEYSWKFRVKRQSDPAAAS